MPLHVLAQQFEGARRAALAMDRPVQGQRFDHAGAAQVTRVVQRFGGHPVGRNRIVGVQAEDRNANSV